jgi:aminoglycoside phosphotransferase (APT) family kinase protein
LSDAASESPKPRRATGAARVGRGIAIALYWTITLWVCISALISVVPQVFWPGERAGGLEELSAEACGVRLRALHRELLEGAAADLSGLAAASPERGRWLEGWDGRYRALEAACSGRPSYDLLLRLRYAIEDDLRWAEGDSTLAHDVVLALDAEDRGN